jgi:nitroreductase
LACFAHGASFHSAEKNAPSNPGIKHLGSWVDYGIFLQNVMVVVSVFGPDTCPQAAVAGYPDILRAEFKVSSHELILCGMALGYADLDMPANQLSSQREPVNAFATVHGA